MQKANDQHIGPAEAPPLGLMQNWPLTIDKIISHAATAFPDIEVVTRCLDRSVRRTSYAEIERQSRKVSRALAAHGLGAGDAVATIAWNSDRHIALWYGISAIGAVCNPVNPRLTAEQIAWILNHAGDTAVFLDLTFLPLIEAIAPALPHVRTYVLLTDEAKMVENSIGAISLEAFLATGEREPEVAWGDFAEDTACALFYTSGTTSDPKGVLYSHRSNVLHALMLGLAYRLSPEDVVMPVVPMFHANCWGFVHVAPMVGTRLVMPGQALDPASLYELIVTEGVTKAAGVPTMWSALLKYLRESGNSVPSLKELYAGGSAVPRALIKAFREEYGVQVLPVWGMTETSPGGTLGGIVPSSQMADPEARLAAEARQGRMVFGVEMAIKDESGRRLPHDGMSSGRLMVRGPAVIASYYKSDRSILDEEGYFDTGDIATLHPDAVMQITDRAKDIVKSGGEWISSAAIEDVAALHPATDCCAVIGIPNPRWDERPLLVVKRRCDARASTEEIRTFLAGKLQKWWIPDEIVFVEELPLGATGKVDKKQLRLMFAEQYGIVGA